MKFSKESFKSALDVCFNYLVPDKVYQVFRKHNNEAFGISEGRNFFADRYTDAFRSSSGICAIAHLTLKVEAIMQSLNLREKHSVTERNTPVHREALDTFP
jgi:hypothetical protein